MKRLFSTLLAALMLFSLVACGSSVPSDDTQEPSEPVIEVEETIETAEEVQGLTSYEEILQIADTNRAPYVAGNAQETLNIDQYAISDKALLTQEEMDTLSALLARMKSRAAAWMEAH